GLPPLERMAMGSDFGQQSQPPCLIAVFLIGTGEFQRMHRMALRFFWATGQQIDLAQPGNPERIAVPYAEGNNVLHRLLQQWEGFGDLPYLASRIAYSGGEPGEKHGNITVLAQGKTTFKQGNGCVECPLTERRQTDAERREHEAKGMIRRLGDPETFLATGHRLSERALLSKGTGEAVSGQHRGKASEAEALLEQIACQQVDI